MALENNRDRQQVIQFVFAIAAALLVGKAMWLQLLDPTYRGENANGAAIQEYTIYPARGVLYDRNDSLLIYNTPVYDVMVTYNQINWHDFDTTRFCELLDITKDEFKHNIEKRWEEKRYSKAIPFPFLSKISPEVCVKFQESMYEFPGFVVQLRHARGYPHHNAAHVLGYIREVNPNEIAKNPKLYELGDYIGASGIEKFYEKELSGTKGTRLALKDNLGRDVGDYEDGNKNTAPQSGADIVTSLSLDLQKYGEQLMQNKIGSIVAIDPKTGEVLAMISSPTYDPNALTLNQGRGEIYRDLLKDPNNIFLDRSVQAMYPPGSLFKPIVALIAMQEGVLNPDRTIGCAMGYYGGGLRTACHSHPTCTNVAMAIQHSCNAYFVTVYRDMLDKYGFYNPQRGLDTFGRFLEKMGLGHRLGIDFPNEKAGFYPSAKYYNGVFERQQAGQKWNSNWVRSVGIGQGEMLLTPLQMANLGAMIANRGYYITPHLIKGYYKNPKKKIDERYQEKHFSGVDRAYFEPVVAGMRAAVTSGTAHVANLPDIPICGKTGTAENPHGKDHSIFYGFAPMDNPRIAIAVYVENAGFGATYAVPIASLMIEKYLTKEVRPDRKFLEERMLKANLLSSKP